MMNFLLPLLLVLASTNVYSQTSLNHGFKSVSEVQGITSWKNNTFVKLRAASSEKLEKVEHVAAFDSSGNLIDQIRIDLNSFILASSASHDELRILLKDDENSRTLHLIQFKNNKFVRSTPITLQEDHQLLSCFGHEGKIFAISINRKKEPSLWIHKVDERAEPGITKSALSQEIVRGLKDQLAFETLFTGMVVENGQLNENEFRYFNPSKEYPLEQLSCKSRFMIAQGKLIMTYRHRSSPTDSHLRIIEFDLGTGESIEKIVKLDYMKAPAFGYHIFDGKIFLLSVSTAVTMDFSIVDYTTTNILKEYHFEKNDILTIKNGPLYRNGIDLEKGKPKIETRKVLTTIGTKECIGVERFGKDGYSVTFGSHFYPVYSTASNISSESNTADEAFFIGILDRDLNPTVATPTPGSYDRLEQRISKIFDTKNETVKEAAQKAREKITKFETEEKLYVLWLSKSSDAVKLYSFSRDELRKD